MEDTHIRFCGFSYHTKGYHSQDTAPLTRYLFRLQTEGTSKITLNGEVLLFKKGDLLLAQPGDTYELKIEENQDSGDYHLSVDGDWIENWWQGSFKPTVSNIYLDERILALWRHLTLEKRRPLTEENKELSIHLVKALCLTLERAVNENEASLNRPFSVTRMLRFIEEHATIGFKVEEVATETGLSVSRAVHLFKETTGKTMIEYAQEIRLSAAVDQMKYTSMTLESIAEKCGFSSYPYFHRVFKRKYGIAPGEYREH
ncbi:AraC family transcriptional regulator [Alkalihalobacillus pseudalcaliphilus]|uniref:AraC family transcriptional regulator n=1 Tax=Alkalihalobacillus pseudalcaliphilus TaxID=79884 RepID=UPI00064DCB05|nr:AraC family transcriptional regulator [Alkalihalobacillus pseudalcaliphilus]KMK78120.1 AraC family transcriptional regulator [Alkalihalobacillus pseudalcaliphilus]